MDTKVEGKVWSNRNMYTVWRYFPVNNYKRRNCNYSGKLDWHSLNHIIKLNSPVMGQKITICFFIYCKKKKEYSIISMVFLPKMHYLNLSKRTDKLRLKDILQNNWPVCIKKCQSLLKKQNHPEELSQIRDQKDDNRVKGII